MKGILSHFKEEFLILKSLKILELTNFVNAAKVINVLVTFNSTVTVLFDRIYFHKLEIFAFPPVLLVSYIELSFSCQN